LSSALRYYLLGAATAVAAALAAGGPGLAPEGYAPKASAVSLDTLRLKTRERATRAGRSALGLGAVIPGYLSSRGLPPVRGQFTITDTGLVFYSAEGGVARQWRASTVSLAYIEDGEERPVYVFRIDGGVFETDAPGPLLEVASHPDWLDSLGATEGPADLPLVEASDSLTVWKTARQIAASPYADSLYALLGRPRAAVGLIGRSGRMAGRLGEYIASRDSLALDPARMSSETQLRHALAHELGHRWQVRAGTQLDMLWGGVPGIRDPKRYGYGDLSEHQAEAIAFAINFLQTTASTRETAANSVNLLDHYELLVPGTRTMVRYLSLRPIYRNHPLRPLLTTGRSR
jgi:hypothetical protein